MLQHDETEETVYAFGLRGVYVFVYVCYINYGSCEL